MKKALLINALIITITSLLLNTVGISFRVIVSNKIGAEGMGLFQLIVSIYMMAVIFVASGINIAITRLVAEEGGRGSFFISRSLLKKSFAVSLLFSIPAYLILSLGADYIGTNWIHDERSILSLRILALSLPSIGISSCIKGYFYGVSKIIRPTSSQAFELAVQIFIIISILDSFMERGLEYACAAIVIGTTISELLSCFYLLVLYRFEKNKDARSAPKRTPPKGIYQKLLSISVPISISSLMRSGLKALENIMIPMGFIKYGYTEKSSLEEYGMIQGMVMPILIFPSSLLAAFSTLLIPEISEANALNQRRRIHYTVTRVLQLTSILSILITGVFILFSDELGYAIYHSPEVGIMMKTLAPLIPLMYLDMVIDALLKGLDQQVSVLKYNLIDSIFRILLVYSFIPLKGVPGLILVMYASSLLNTTLSLCKLLKVSQVKMKIRDWIFKPILSVTASGFLVLYLFKKINLGVFPFGIYITLGILLVSILYVFFLTRLGSLSKDDIKWFKSIFRYSKEVQLNTGLINKEI